MKQAMVILLVTLTALTTGSFGADITLAPPSGVSASDVPNDVGTQIRVIWSPSPDEVEPADGGVWHESVAEYALGGVETQLFDYGAIDRD